MLVSIRRKFPRKGLPETPARTARGYQLASPKLDAKAKNKVEHATFVRTLEEAADLIDQGYLIWMVADGKRASLIIPQSLVITR
ncbi:MAG: hypothetical protein IT548_19260 [Alphaproteobacteria bacterium]|nr:hypothetical protein [Alphaproteobacteria bacterium]